MQSPTDCNIHLSSPTCKSTVNWSLASGVCVGGGGGFTLFLHLNTCSSQGSLCECILNRYTRMPCISHSSMAEGVCQRYR